MNLIRNGMLGVVGAACGVLLQGCFAKQPVPECQVFTGQYVSSTSNYIATMKKTAGTGSCSELKAMEVGMTRFSGDAGFTVAVRPSPLIDLAYGYVNATEQDNTNNCAWFFAGEDCSTCTEATPESDPNNDNICMPVLEPVTRTDPKDPDGKGLQGQPKITRVADTNGQCTIDDFVLAQDFEATTATQPDGGTVNFPETKVKYEWSTFKTMMTTRVPGSAWTAHLKYTVDGCTAEYDVTGIWPMVTCSTDEDCNPNANPDAGRVTGSGLSPDFKPRCDLTVPYRASEYGYLGNYDLTTTVVGNYTGYANTVHHGVCVLGNGVDITKLQ